MEIIYYEDKYLDSLNDLLESVFGLSKIYNSISDDFEIIAIDGGEVVGYLALNKCVDTLSGKNYFYVNYVCVKEEYRRSGIATNLFDKVFEVCEKLDIAYLELTSNSKRVGAHKLYEKLGFSVRETVVFRKELL